MWRLLKQVHALILALPASETRGLSLPALLLLLLLLLTKSPRESWQPV